MSKQPDAPIYPNVRCADGPDEPGYVTCTHVMKGRRVGHFVPASTERLGEAVCVQCRASRSIGTLRLTCVHCVRRLAPERFN